MISLLERLRPRPRNRPLAHRGALHTMSYITQPTDCVQRAGIGLEWSDKPPVVASTAVIRLCEQACMQALLPVMPQGHYSLGCGQQLDHTGPIVIGAEIRIAARCVRARAFYSRWQVTVQDAHGTVGTGWMDFVVVGKVAFEARRVAPKYAALRKVPALSA